MAWWIWVLSGLALLAFEILTPGGIIFLFFGVAAMIVGVLVAAGVGGPIWFQWLLFSVLSIASLLTLRGPILRRMHASSEDPDQIDTLVGQKVLLVQSIAPDAEGQAELRGTQWLVENVGEESLGKGQHGVVERVEGLKLFVRSPE